MKQFTTKGFTLLEMLLVSGIIAILVSMGIMYSSTLQQKSRDARRKTDLQQIQSAIEMYRFTNNGYPPGLTAGLPVCDPTPGCPPGTTKYLEKVPDDPRPLKTYYYTAGGNDYTAGVLLEGTGGITCGDCQTTSGTQPCNYCVGPYGQK